jgi:hypothetical protein
MIKKKDFNGSAIKIEVDPETYNYAYKCALYNQKVNECMDLLDEIEATFKVGGTTSCKLMLKGARANGHFGMDYPMPQCVSEFMLNFKINGKLVGKKND